MNTKIEQEMKAEAERIKKLDVVAMYEYGGIVLYTKGKPAYYIGQCKYTNDYLVYEVNEIEGQLCKRLLTTQGFRSPLDAKNKIKKYMEVGKND